MQNLTYRPEFEQGFKKMEKFIQLKALAEERVQ